MFGSIPRKFPSHASLRFGWVATRRDEKFTPLPVFEASCDFVTSVGSKQPTEATIGCCEFIQAVNETIPKRRQIFSSVWESL